MKISRTLLAAVASVSMLGLAGAASAQELVTNGGFEAGSFAGWTRIGNTGNTFVTGSFGRAPASGSFQGAFGAVGSIGGISQDIVTVAGQSYTISFDLANFNSNGTGTSLIQFGGTTLQNLTGANDFNYTRFSYTGTATSALTSLSLQFRQDPSYFLLDNVSVQAATAAVPEPATWAMMLIGFGAIGFGMRRRSSVRTSVRFA